MPEIQYIQDRMETEELLENLSPPVRNWFKEKFPDFTDPQKIAIPRIMNGETSSALLTNRFRKDSDRFPVDY